MQVVYSEHFLQHHRSDSTLPHTTPLILYFRYFDVHVKKGSFVFYHAIDTINTMPLVSFSLF